MHVSIVKKITIWACEHQRPVQAAAAAKGKGKASTADKLSQLRTALLEELGLAQDVVQLTEAAPLPDELLTIAQVGL